jgi:hypothetical protein
VTSTVSMSTRTAVRVWDVKLADALEEFRRALRVGGRIRVASYDDDAHHFAVVDADATTLRLTTYALRDATGPSSRSTRR